MFSIRMTAEERAEIAKALAGDQAPRMWWQRPQALGPWIVAAAVEKAKKINAAKAAAKPAAGRRRRRGNTELEVSGTTHQVRR